jgi:hypothetical protein
LAVQILFNEIACGADVLQNSTRTIAQKCIICAASAAK